MEILPNHSNIQRHGIDFVPEFRPWTVVRTPRVGTVRRVGSATRRDKKGRTRSSVLSKLKMKILLALQAAPSVEPSCPSGSSVRARKDLERRRIHLKTRRCSNVLFTRPFWQAVFHSVGINGRVAVGIGGFEIGNVSGALRLRQPVGATGVGFLPKLACIRYRSGGSENCRLVAVSANAALETITAAPMTASVMPFISISSLLNDWLRTGAEAQRKMLLFCVLSRAQCTM